MAKKVQKRYLFPSDYMADPSVHVFDGKLYLNRQITLEGKTEDENIVVLGWDIEKTAADGTVEKTHEDGATYTFNVPACKSLSINAVLGDQEQTGIARVNTKNWRWNVVNNELHLNNVPAGTLVTLYNLQGMQLKQIKADGSNIQMPLKKNQAFILKVGSENIKIK